MAKMVIEFDTNDKSLSVTLDGQAVNNVVGAEVYRRGYYGYGGPDDDEDEDQEFAFSVMTAEKDKDNDLTRMTRIVASESAEGQLQDTQALTGLPGFKRVSARSRQDDKAVRDIVNFFARDDGRGE